MLLPKELVSNGMSTHNCSVNLLATVLTGVKDKRVVVLGIQPESLDWGVAGEVFLQ